MPISLFTCISDTSTVSRLQRLGHLLGLDDAARARLEVGDAAALAFELSTGVEHGRVLGARGDQVTRAIALETHGAEDRQVVGFGGTRGEQDLVRLGADERRDVFARALDPPVASRPGACDADAGFAYAPSGPRHSTISATTRGSTGVVAALSR